MYDFAFDNAPVTYRDDHISTDILLRPKIVTPLPLKQSIKVGEELRLLCLLTGHPSTQIQWYLNGEVLEETEDERIKFDNQKRLLVIKDLKFTDAGSITFEAKNKYGEESSNCLLDVVSNRDVKFGNHSKKRAMMRLKDTFNRRKSF